MALNDNAVFVAATGYVFVAPNGTPAPTPAQLDALNLTTFAGLNAAWTQVGHTSRETLPEFDTEGGDTKVRGTWQKQRLREVQTGDPNVDSVKLVLEQWDTTTLPLFFGSPDPTAPTGVFGVTGNYVPLEYAMLIILVDGSTVIGFYTARAAITRDGALKLPLDDFAGLPIKASFLDYPGARLYDWISQDLFGTASPATYTLNLNGATAGTITLKVAGAPTAAINVSGITTSTILTALAAIDDGYTSSQFTVTGTGPFVITAPAVVTLGTNSATGGVPTVQ